MLQAHGLILQNRDIILCPFILDILPFQQIHVIDNRCQRRLDIMGHIGDQVGFQPLVLDALFHRCRQAASHLVHCLRKSQIIAADLVGGNLHVQFPCGDPLDAVQDPLPLSRLPEQENSHTKVKERQQDNSNFPHYQEHYVYQQKACIGKHGLRGGLPLLHHLPESTADQVENTVLPQGMGLDSAYQADITGEKHSIQHKGHAPAHQGEFRQFQIPYRDADRHQNQDNPGRYNQNQRRQLRPYPVKAVQHNLAVLVSAASCCQSQIHHAQQIQNRSQHHAVDRHPAYRRDFLILLLILGQLIARLISGVHSYHQNIIPFHGRRIALHIAAQFA